MLLLSGLFAVTMLSVVMLRRACPSLYNWVRQHMRGSAMCCR